MGTSGQSKRLFLVFFISYLIISLIPMGLLGYTWSKTDRMVVQQTQEAGDALAEQIQSIMDERLNEVEMMSNQIYMNQNAQLMMYSSAGFGGDNTLRALKLIKDMSAYVNMSDFVHSAFVYFSGMDLLMSDTSTAKPRLFYQVNLEPFLSWEAFNELLTANYNSPSSPSPHQIVTKSDEKQYHLFWYSMPTGRNGRVLGNICVVVESEKFNVIFSGIEDSYDGMAYMLGADNQLIAASSSAADWPAVSTQLNGRNMQRITIERREYIVLNKVSSKSQKKLVVLLPSERVYQPVFHIRRIFYLALGAGLFLMIGLATLFTLRTYRPLQRVVQQVDAETETHFSTRIGALNYIETGVRNLSNQKKQWQDLAQRSQQVMRNSFVNHLLSNAYDGNLEHFLRDCQLYGVSLKEQCFCVLIVHLDSSERFENNLRDRDNASVWYMISDMVERLTDEGELTVTANYERNCLCAILNFPRESAGVTERLSKAATQLKELAEREYPAIATVGIGSVEENFTGIHTSYLNALRALEYRMVQGLSSIISYGDLSATTNENAYYEYTAEVEKRLENSVRAGNYDETEALITELFQSSFVQRATSMTMVRCLLYDLVSTTLRLLNTMDIPMDDVFGDRDPIVWLGGCETVDEALEHFKQVYRRICDFVGSKKRSHNDRLRQEIEEFIQQNYVDENLSQQMIADQFGKSANYLSFFFREQTGEKMSSYISNLRIQKAMKLLRETDDSVKEIAAQTGFASDLNFIRAFKKQQNETPGQYRKNYRGN